MDQSFSVKNFRLIYDLDLRTRGDLEHKYFENAHIERQKIKFLKTLKYRTILGFKKNLIPIKSYEKRINLIKNLLSIRKDRYNNYINNKLDIICKEVNQKIYKLPLSKSSTQIDGKDIFTIGQSLESIFVTRHLNRIIANIYNIKHSYRNLIISRIKTICLDKSPKYIIKADLQSFYESIDHEILIQKLHSTSQLSVLPKRILTQLIRSYAKLASSNKGLPRGVGLSAYLSEVYMKEIDDELKNTLDLTFYSRYVDDLILIYSSNNFKNKSYYIKLLTEAVSKKELKLNSNKTTIIDSTSNKSQEFEYLGYKFIFKDMNISIRLSSKRVDKYKKRLDTIFDSYLKRCKYNPKEKSNLITDQIRFLTGNTRLLHSKSGAFTGVYFNNIHINDLNDLDEIDKYLKIKLSIITDPRLNRRLNKFSFKTGFEKIVFRNFSTDELKNITRGWKNA